jgi:hypothetical protein
MVIPFLFWNLKERPLQNLAVELAVEYGIRLVILTECALDSATILLAFRKEGLGEFEFCDTPARDDSDIKVFMRLPGATLEPVYDDPNNHVSIRRLMLSNGSNLLLVIVHSQSKRNWSDDDQILGTTRLSRRISDCEEEHLHRRTVLVGDLNMNPFEKGVVGSEGLHAVMTKRIAEAGHRVVDAADRHFFYNPMWRFFGERTDSPPGTYYYAAAGKPIAYYWNVFDQVLVRPSLMNRLTDVRILDRVKGVSLLDTRGIPDPEIGSDHLPLVFALDL